MKTIAGIGAELRRFFFDGLVLGFAFGLSRSSYLVVVRPSVRIGQNFIRVQNLLELARGAVVSRISVGMKAKHRFAISTLNILLASAALDA